MTHTQAIARIQELEALVRQWKANHEDMAARNAFLRQRPDLPADRLPVADRLIAERTAARQQLGRLVARGRELFPEEFAGIGTDHPAAAVAVLESLLDRLHRWEK